MTPAPSNSPSSRKCLLCVVITAFFLSTLSLSMLGVFVLESCRSVLNYCKPRRLSLALDPAFPMRFVSTTVLVSPGFGFRLEVVHPFPYRSPFVSHGTSFRTRLPSSERMLLTVPSINRYRWSHFTWYGRLPGDSVRALPKLEVYSTVVKIPSQFLSPPPAVPPKLRVFKL